jgi:hypothetical protein
VSAAPRTAVLARPLAVANVGTELFAAELERQGVPVERVDWRPPVRSAPGGPAAAAGDRDRA